MGAHTMIVSRVKGSGPGGPTRTAAGAPPEGSATRQRILAIALTLMSQRGVDGTSMRDLAAAAGLNVASLYHYFPSKRDLLESVLVEQGFLPIRAARDDGVEPAPEPADLAELLAEVLVSMFEVEEFVRLMVCEAMRDETTARTVGLDLFSSFEASMTEWVLAHRPDLAARSGADAVARLLSAAVLGIFVQHAAGVLADGQDLTAFLLRRASEVAALLPA